MFFKIGLLRNFANSTRKHLCWSPFSIKSDFNKVVKLFSIKFLWNFFEITPRHGCSQVNLLHIFRTPCPRNTSRWLLLDLETRLLNIEQLSKYLNSCTYYSIYFKIDFGNIYWWKTVVNFKIYRLINSNSWWEASIFLFPCKFSFWGGFRGFCFSKNWKT